MATKAEQVEKLAKHIWYRVVRPGAARGGKSYLRTLSFEALGLPFQQCHRDMARWHLRKVAEAEAKGKGKIVYVYDDGTCE